MGKRRQNRSERMTTLRAAEAASMRGDHATASRLFHKLGISYVPSYVFYQSGVDTETDTH